MPKTRTDYATHLCKRDQLFQKVTPSGSLRDIFGRSRDERRLSEVRPITPLIRQRLGAWAQRARDRIAARRDERGRKVFMPDSTYRAYWDFINVIMLSWTTFEIPVSLLFVAAEQSTISCEWSVFSGINLAVDSLFLIDILISMNTAYFDANGYLVDGRKEILTRYLSFWFPVDLLTSLPVDQIICGLDLSIDASVVRSIKIVRLLKLARVLKFLRILKKWEQASGSPRVRKVFRMGKWVVLKIFVIHSAACIWMVPVAQGPCAPDSEAYANGNCKNWMSVYDKDLMHAPWGSKYLAAVYYAVVTLATVGYGDVVPTNDMERGVAACMALCGAVIFAFCIGSLSSLASEGNSTESEIDLTLKSMHDFLQYCKTSTATQQYAKQQILFTATTTPHRIHKCLEILPRRLKARIIEDYLKQYLEGKGCTLFGCMDEECRCFISQYLYPVVLPANEFLFRALETGMEMYFITWGEVEVLNVTELKVITRLRKGEFFGEIALFPDLIAYRTCSVRSTVVTHVFELRGEDLEHHIKPHFPDVYEAIREVATVRFRWMDIDPLVKHMCKQTQQRCSDLQGEALNHEQSRVAILKKALKEDIEATGSGHGSTRTSIIADQRNSVISDKTTGENTGGVSTRAGPSESFQQDMKTVRGCLENTERKDFAGSRTGSRTARHQGPVKKRGLINPAYKQRFFVLTDDELCYFENERAYLENHKGGLRGSIPIIQVRVTRCTPKDERDKWVVEILEALRLKTRECVTEEARKKDIQKDLSSAKWQSSAVFSRSAAGLIDEFLNVKANRILRNADISATDLIQSTASLKLDFDGDENTPKKSTHSSARLPAVAASPSDRDTHTHTHTHTSTHSSSRLPSVAGSPSLHREPPPSSTQYSNRTLAPPIKHANEHRQRNTSPQRWNESYGCNVEDDPIALLQSPPAASTPAPHVMSPGHLRPNETQFQLQVLQQLRMLASQVENVSSDLHSIKTAMNSLQTDQHVMRHDVDKLKEMVGNEDAQLEQLKKLVDGKRKNTHAESLKKFGYTSALVGSDQW